MYDPIKIAKVFVSLKKYIDINRALPWSGYFICDVKRAKQSKVSVKVEIN